MNLHFQESDRAVSEGPRSHVRTHPLQRDLVALLSVWIAAAAHAQEWGIEDPVPPLVRSVAGSGVPGARDQVEGGAALAQFYRPEGIAVDSLGNIILADTENRLIRWIGRDGTVRTIAGQARVDGIRDGLGTEAQFSGPSSVAVAPNGTIFVADSTSHLIRRIDPDGTVLTIAGKARRAGFADGPGTNAVFSIPAGVALDQAGVLYVADRLNHVVRKISPSNDVELFAGVPGQPGFADGGRGMGRFNNPTAVAAAGGFVYVVDTSNNAIRKIHPEGRVETIGGIHGRFGYRDGVAFESDFNYPRGIAVDLSGHVYVADTANHVIRKISPQGLVTTLAGKGGYPGNYEGTGISARLNEPRGIATAPDGALVIADTWNHRVCRMTAGLAGGTFDRPLRIGKLGDSFEASFTHTQDSWVWNWVRKPPESTLEAPLPGATHFQLTPDRVGLYTLRASTTNDSGRINWRHLELMVVNHLDVSPSPARRGAGFTLRVPGGPGIGGHLQVWMQGQWRFMGTQPLPLPENEFADPFPTDDTTRFYRIMFLPAP